MRSNWLTPAVIAAMVIFSIVIYNRLPDEVPVHWDSAGQVDRTFSPFEAGLFFPAFAAFLAVFFPIVRRADPRRAAYLEFEDTFWLIINATVLFMAGLQVVVLGDAAGWDIELYRVIAVGAGLLAMVLGNVMGRIRPNWFIGIRTPWTLSDEQVWRQTHRVGGRLMFAGGVLLIALAVALPGQWGVGPVAFLAFLWAAFTFGYSYVLWLRRQNASG